MSIRILHVINIKCAIELNALGWLCEEQPETTARQRGYTRLAVQMKTGIERALLSKYENGGRVPPTEAPAQLEDFYGCLLCRTDDPPVHRLP